MKKKLLGNKLLVLIIIGYFLIRLINLTIPPLFNDEAIYLDWGYREIHKEGFLFYSLYDGKQPFLMWIFGITETFFSPAFSGRIVSVFAGFITLIGLYKISEILFNKNVGIISAIFYTVIPIFSFYDRQALMESSIAAVGVWAFYFLLKIFKENENKYALGLGLVLGIGYFIKTTSLIFLVSSIIILFLFNLQKKSNIAQKLFIVISAFLVSVFILLINPEFWRTIGSNSRYAFSLNELLTFPIVNWINTFISNIEISLFYLTPLVFFAFIFGIILIFRNKELDKRLIVSYLLLGIILESLTVRSPSERYLVSFLPLTTVAISYLIYALFKKEILKAKILFLGLVLLPLALTFFQVINQPEYILLTGRFTGFNHVDYLESFSSGYGVPETIGYIKKLSNGENIVVGFAENTGNPESAILIEFAKNKKIQPAYLDARLIQTDISDYECLKTPIPVFFVSRDNQQAGLEKFFEKIVTIKNPYGKNTIGIYKLKTNCPGKILEIHPQYNPT